jgi:hypothetical protein
MHPLAPGSCRRTRAEMGSLHGQPSVERPSPIVLDERSVHDNVGLARERSKGGSTVARQRHRHRVLLHSTRHHSHHRRPPNRRSGARMHEFGRDYQPPFDNVKRRLRERTLAFRASAGTNTPVETASEAALAWARNLQETVTRFTFRTRALCRRPALEAPQDEVRDPASDSCSRQLDCA